MWRKTEESKPQPSPDVSASPAPSPQRPATAVPPVFPNAPAGVSRGIKIKGEISGRDDLVLDGEFEGTIRLTDGSFTVGPNGHVNADVIEAREIIVRGEVVGTLKARERVQVWSTGRVTGDMETRGVVIEDGAILHSKVEVRQKNQPPQPGPAAVPSRAKEAVAAAAAPAPAKPQNH